MTGGETACQKDHGGESRVKTVRSLGTLYNSGQRQAYGQLPSHSSGKWLEEYGGQKTQVQYIVLSMLERAKKLRKGETKWAKKEEGKKSVHHPKFQKESIKGKVQGIGDAPESTLEPANRKGGNK